MGNPMHIDRAVLRRRPARAARRVQWKPVVQAGAALLMAWTLQGATVLHGQAPAAPATPQVRPAAQPEKAHKRVALHGAGPHAKPAAAHAVPAAPPKPNWPAEQPPNPAKVSWDSQGLAIEASNSSLEQILRDVATDTGVQLQGLNQDERIFGKYGPGPAREVLSRLLEGSGYNVLMIGGQGDEPPQQIILTKSAGASPQPASAPSANSDDDADEPQQPTQLEQPRPIRAPFNLPPDRSPQEVQQEMLQQQQQMEQQREQQQQQENNPQY